MIIKYTFKDNDFTQVIETYLDEFGPFYIMNFPTNLAYDKFKELLKKYDDYYDKYSEEKDITLDEVKEIRKELTTMLKANFAQYISNIRPNSNWHTEGMDAIGLQDNKEYILNHIHIEIVKSVTDQWENGEAVYYFTSNMKYVTM